VVLLFQHRIRNMSSGEKRSYDQEDNDKPSNKRSRGSNDQDLRLLLASKNAGAVIGKGGDNIKRLRSEYNASVTIPDSNSPERVLNISADIGTISKLLTDIIPRLDDVKGDEPDHKCELKMLVHQSQAGAVIGRQGNTIKQIREETSSEVRVFKECCPLSYDRIVNIKGTIPVAVDCVMKIFEVLESAPVKGPEKKYDPQNYDEYSVSEYGGYEFSGKGMGGRNRGGGGGGSRGGMNRDSMNRNGRSNMSSGRDMGRMGGNYDNYDRMRGGRGMYDDDMDSYRGRGMDHSMDRMNRRMNSSMGGSSGGDGGGNRSSTQVSIPKDMVGAIMGKAGSRIRNIKMQSCADIHIAEADRGSEDRIITIKGTEMQIRDAQYLLQKSVKENY